LLFSCVRGVVRDVRSPASPLARRAAEGGGVGGRRSAREGVAVFCGAPTDVFADGDLFAARRSALTSHRSALAPVRSIRSTFAFERTPTDDLANAHRRSTRNPFLARPRQIGIAEIFPPRPLRQ
jgi:hypothetical protein